MTKEQIQKQYIGKVYNGIELTNAYERSYGWEMRGKCQKCGEHSRITLCHIDKITCKHCNREMSAYEKMLHDRGFKLVDTFWGKQLEPIK